MIMFTIFSLLFLACVIYLAKTGLRYFTFRYYYNELVVADPRLDFDELVKEEKKLFQETFDDGVPVTCILGVISLGYYLLSLPFNFL